MLDEDSKIVALKSIIPDTVFQHQFKGKTFRGFQEMRQELTNYLTDKQISINNKGRNDIGAMGDDSGSDENGKENHLDKKLSEMLAAIEIMGKGCQKGKGKGGGWDYNGGKASSWKGWGAKEETKAKERGSFNLINLAGRAAGMDTFSASARAKAAAKARTGTSTCAKMRAHRGTAKMQTRIGATS